MSTLYLEWRDRQVKTEVVQAVAGRVSIKGVRAKRGVWGRLKALCGRRP